MAITFNINIERNPNSIIDVDIQLLAEDGAFILTEDGLQLAAG